ncbi:bcl-2-like protein 11 [Symphorus nematophorus]
MDTHWTPSLGRKSELPPEHEHIQPPNRSDGSTAVTTAQGSGGDPPPAGATGASAQNSRSGNSGERSSGHPSSTGGGAGEPDSPSWCRPKPTSPHDSLGVFQTRSIFPRRASSGYFSSDCDSLPSSPLSPRPLMADSATQTPSPTGQMMQHALYRMAEAHGGGPGMHQQHGPSPSPSSMRPQHAAGDMQTEAIGRELRRIGDEFNGMLLLRQISERLLLLEHWAKAKAFNCSQTAAKKTPVTVNSVPNVSE